MRRILLALLAALAVAGPALAQQTNEPVGADDADAVGDAQDTQPTTGDTTQEAAGNDGRMNPLWWIIPVLLALGLLVWALTRRRADTGERVTSVNASRRR